MKKAVIRVVDPQRVRVNLSIEMDVQTLCHLRSAIRDKQSERYEHGVGAVLRSVEEAIHTVEQKFIGMVSEEETP